MCIHSPALIFILCPYYFTSQSFFSPFFASELGIIRSFSVYSLIFLVLFVVISRSIILVSFSACLQKLADQHHLSPLI